MTGEVGILNVGAGDQQAPQIVAMRLANISRARVKYEGAVFGRLMVIEYLPGRSGLHASARCKCSCGREIATMITNMVFGRTKSCGCLNTEMRVLNNVTHGGSHRSEYIVWRSMIQRCGDPNHRAYQNYGGRGVHVCERWGDFSAFLADLGPRPSKQYSLDRYPDQSGNYEPSNCRWATRSQQANNRRNNRLIAFGGKTLTLAEWSHQVGLSVATIRARLDEYGYTIEAALTVPVYGGRP